MALAGAKTAVQVRALAHLAIEGALDHAECLIEALHQLWRGDVVAHGLGGRIQAIRQAQDEVALMNLLRQVKNLAQFWHLVVSLDTVISSGLGGSAGSPATGAASKCRRAPGTHEIGRASCRERV